MIPLPNESVTKTVKTIKAKIRQINESIGKKARDLDEKMITRTYFKMMKYLKSSGNFSLDDVNDLLMNMERSILCLQRKKKKLVEKMHKRKV